MQNIKLSLSNFRTIVNRSFKSINIPISFIYSNTKNHQIFNIQSKVQKIFNFFIR